MATAQTLPPGPRRIEPAGESQPLSLGDLVLQQWQRDGYGIPGASVQLKHWIQVPVDRDDDCPKALLTIALRKSGVVFWASLQDADVEREATELYRVDELEAITDRYGVEIDAQDLTITELFTRPGTPEDMALGVFRLWQCCQSILDHGQGWSNQYRRKGQ